MILWNSTSGPAVQSVTCSDLRMAIVLGASSPSTICRDNKGEGNDKGYRAHDETFHPKLAEQRLKQSDNRRFANPAMAEGRECDTQLACRQVRIQIGGEARSEACAPVSFGDEGIDPAAAHLDHGNSAATKNPFKKTSRKIMMMFKLNGNGSSPTCMPALRGLSRCKDRRTSSRVISTGLISNLVDFRPSRQPTAQG